MKFIMVERFLLRIYGLQISQKLLKFGIMFLPIFLNNSCNAPRNNPLDPNNPNNAFVSIEGMIQTYAVPRKAVSDALVSWKIESRLVKTNSSGYFKIDNIHAKNGWLLIQKEGYSSDSFYIEWQYKKNYTVQSFLNEIPKLDSLLLFTTVLNQYPNIQTASLEVKVKVSDKDNDIDSVFIENSELSTKHSLTYNVTSKMYERILSQSDLNIDDIEQSIGLQFNIKVKDLFSRMHKIGSDKLNRLIKQEITLEYPLNGEIVQSMPILKWRRFTPGFDFTYTAEILTDDIPPATVWQKEKISSDSISVEVSTVLAPRGYFWVLWCIDKFSNKSRSKPASFKVN
jgi:hypothetical protein